jgi:putative endonuclease
VSRESGWVDKIPSFSRTDNDSDRSSEIAMECFVYVLGSWGKDGYRTYVGWTTDLDRRLAQHNAGTGARSTRGRVWVLLYAEQHATRREAMSREWHLKRDRRLRKRLARSG